MDTQVTSQSRITESLKLEEIFKITNHQPTTTMLTKPHPTVPHLHVSLNASRDSDSNLKVGFSNIGT